ncbi:MAG: beta-ketoacyl synthase N-terminal-like domain-containing protein, partial [Anaerolineales bacterium]
MATRRNGRRVVVTGLGVVSPIGIGADRFWNSLMEGRSGVRRISTWDPSALPTQIAAEVPDFDPSAFMDRKEARRNDRFVQFAYAASRMALD